MYIQCTVLGFEPTTFQSWVVTHNHNTRAPALFLGSLVDQIIVDFGPWWWSTLTIRIRILLTPTVFSIKFVFENNENKQRNRPGWAHLKK